MTKPRNGSTFVDRYHEAGLTHNPFVSPQLPAALDVNVDAIYIDRGLSDPPAPGSRSLVQVIGEEGMGKSTQLQWWRSSQPGPFHYIPREPYRDRWATPPVRQPTIYGDEIDRMPVVLRRRWFKTLAKAKATLIIGTHVDLTALGQRSGFTVITHHLETLDAPKMREMIDARLAACSNGVEPRLELSDADIDLILSKSRGIPRDADEICHTLVAERVM